MAALVSTIPVDEIIRRGKHAKPGRVAASAAFGVLFGLTWLVAQVLRGLWLVLACCWFAVDEGWRQAWGTRRPGPDVSAMRHEIAQLRAENLRLGGDG